MQAGELAVGIEAGGEPALRDRAVEVVRLVLLAAPDQLDRDVREFLGDRHGLVDVSPGCRRAGRSRRRGRCRWTSHLASGTPEASDSAASEASTFWRRHPDLGLVGRELHRGVHRLHAGMGEERRAVDRLDLFRRALDRLGRVAVLPRAVGGGRGQTLLEVLGDGRARLRCARALVPDDRQRIERRLRPPPGIGDDRDAGVLHLHHLAHARACRRSSPRRSSSACRRTPGNP